VTVRENGQPRQILTETRIDLGMTKAALAREAGVGRSTVERAEAGEPISPVSQARIARILGRDRRELFGAVA
jgi:transcriptional regulator with XRE-family HTH domain